MHTPVHTGFGSLMKITSWVITINKSVLCIQNLDADIGYSETCMQGPLLSPLHLALCQICCPSLKAGSLITGYGLMDLVIAFYSGSGDAVLHSCAIHLSQSPADLTLRSNPVMD